MSKRDMAIVPNSDLARFLAMLKRSDRRDLLALVQTPPGPRRVRLERKFRKRLVELGLA